jgi:hypothetical protein
LISRRSFRNDCTYVEGFESFGVVRLCVDLVIAFVVVIIFVFFVAAGAGLVVGWPRVGIDWTLERAIGLYIPKMANG